MKEREYRERVREIDTQIKKEREEEKDKGIDIEGETKGLKEI